MVEGFSEALRADGMVSDQRSLVAVTNVRQAQRELEVENGRRVFRSTESRRYGQRPTVSGGHYKCVPSVTEHMAK